MAKADAIGLEELRVSTTLHMVTAELGYGWLFWRRRITLRAALGFAGTLASNTTITSTSSSASATEAAALATAGAARLDDVYTRYAFFPTVSVSLGYRF